jgi:hypothetical protein
MKTSHQSTQYPATRIRRLLLCGILFLGVGLLILFVLQVGSAYTEETPGEIIVEKQTYPNDSEQQFTFKSSYTDTFDLVDGQKKPSGDLSSSAVAGKIYSVTEMVPAGWQLTALSCSSNVRSTAIFPDAIDLLAGETVTCLFVNEIHFGNIVVVKEVDPAGLDKEFTFAPNYTSTFTLTHGMLKDSGQILPSSEMGPYWVTEKQEEGWLAPEVTCVGDGERTVSATNIDLQPDEIVTCLFLNKPMSGTIIVQKETDPVGSDRIFTFQSNFTNTFGLTDGQSEVIDGLPPVIDAGIPYSITEAVPEGWMSPEVSCVGAGDRPVDATNIVLQPGETVTCLFENTEKGRILVDKVTLPRIDLQEFEFFLTSREIFQRFVLSDTSALFFSGFLTPNVPYTVTETALNNWDLTAASCTGDFHPTGAFAPAGFVLQPGETVICTFENTKRAKITGVKWQDKFQLQLLTPQPDGIRQQFGMDGIENTPDDEGPLQGWIIELWNVTVEPAQRLISRTTNSDGYYEFDLLEPGIDYLACEVGKAVYTQTFPSNDGHACGSVDPAGNRGYAPYGHLVENLGPGVNWNADFGNQHLCTSTQGYWKTHSIYGLELRHPGWDNLILDYDDGPGAPGEMLSFFGMSMTVKNEPEPIPLTWWGVLDTNPKGGNAYFILGHHYVAATLNVLNDADPTDLGDALSEAEELLSNPAIGPDYDWKKDLQGYRSIFISLAETLDRFNNGDIGPGHCDE